MKIRFLISGLSDLFIFLLGEGIRLLRNVFGKLLNLISTCTDHKTIPLSGVINYNHP